MSARTAGWAAVGAAVGVTALIFLAYDRPEVMMLLGRFCG